MASSSSTSSPSASGTTSTSSRKPRKVNLLNHPSIKHVLDESVLEVFSSKGYVVDHRVVDLKLLTGFVSLAIALAAQFYPKKFPENRGFIITCIALYLFSTGLLLLIAHLKEKNAILFTYPATGSLNSSGLMVASKLPRYSDMYMLTVDSRDPKSFSGRKPVQLTKSVTKWFTRDGVLIEGLFWKDVERLIGDYSRDLKRGEAP